MCLFSTQSAHLIADVAGYFSSSGSLFTGVSPARVLDTRSGNGAALGKLVGGSTVVLQVAGRGGVPVSGVSSVMLNVTVTEPGGDGYVTVFPCGSGVPGASNLNYVAGQTIPNLVAVKTDSLGRVCLFSTQSAHLIADVAGYFSSSGSLFTGVSPARVLDTRSGNGAALGKLVGGSTVVLQVAGRGGVPVSGVSSVMLNVTVTEPGGDGYVTVFPCGSGVPGASNLNYVAGQTIPNLVAVKTDSLGRVCLFSTRSTHLIADIASYAA